MAIEMGKKYRTRDGRDVRILCVDRAHESLPVVGLIGEDVMTWRQNGAVWQSREAPGDLVEISPYSDIEIDAPGWARASWWTGPWCRGHFAGLHGNGKPKMWAEGMTSHTAQGRMVLWDEFTTTKPEGAP